MDGRGKHLRLGVCRNRWWKEGPKEGRCSAQWEPGGEAGGSEGGWIDCYHVNPRQGDGANERDPGSRWKELRCCARVV